MNLLKLFVSIGVRDEASRQVDTIGQKLGGGLALAAKVGIAAVSAATTAVVALSKTAVQSLAEYEQLADGASKIFDEMDTTKILNDAQEAYKNFNMSANQYLSIMNDVGATFSATMGDEAGYETAKRGLQAIADYGSGTGKSVDLLSQKFMMITRSTASYQSIADQFSGILPATSAAFLEQAQAAGYLESSYKTLTEVPVDEYQAAVALMLERGVAGLNLTGNAARESSRTITGSLAATKAAWQNLMTALAGGGADIQTVLGQFVESATNAVNNIVPVLFTAIAGIGTLVQEAAPIIIDQLPAFVEQILPVLLDTAWNLVLTVGAALPGILDTILGILFDYLWRVIESVRSTAASWLEAGWQLLQQLGQGILNGFLELMAMMGQWVDENIIQPVRDAGQAALEAGQNVIDKIKEGISRGWSSLTSWFNNLWNSLFGNRSVHVDVAHSSAGGYAIGLDYVPANNFPALLHRGEAVLTASEAEEWRRGKSNNTPFVINQYIQTVPQTPVEIAAATEAYFEQARWAF